MPETTVTTPLGSVEVSVERSSELLKSVEMAKSKCAVRRGVELDLEPRLRAFGTLKTTREEHEPAVTVACRSWMSM